MSLTKAELREEAAMALLEWAETTHGNEFGHDHHCRIPHADQYDKGAWVTPPGDPKQCTCGWSAFRLAYDEAQKP